MGPYGLGASALGVGGAVVATAGGSEALLWNPAALPAEGWDLGYHGGLGGPSQSLEQALVVSGPVDQGVYGGLLLEDQTYPRSGDYHEDTVGAGLSAGIGRWLSIGTLQKLEFANPGSLTGWSMDAGALLAVPLGGSWRLRLGASGSDLVSSLAWGDGLVEDQATVTRLGGALEAAPGTWLAFEQDTLDAQGNGGQPQWRTGLQWAFLDQALLLRAGATGAQAGSLYYTAGLGGCLPWTGRRMEADYAVLVPADGPSVGAFRQALSLRWRFDIPRPFKAALAQELKDRMGRVHWARIALAPGPQDVQEWSLELRDRHGRVVRVLRGAGLLPPGVAWDGKDEAGQPVDAAGLSYMLRATRAGGIMIEHHALLAPEPDLGLADALQGSELGDFGTRASAPVARVKPVVRLKGANDLAVSQADFDLSGIEGASQASSWELRIVNAAGQTVRTLSGKGPPPKSVRWEGTNDLGRPVEESIGTTFEVRVTSPEGVQRVAAAAPVVSEAGFTEMARGAEERELVPSAACGRDPRTGELMCTLYFERYLAQLTDSDRDALEGAARTARDEGLKSATIDGHADGEGGRAATDRLSQDRADTVLKFLMERKVGLVGVTAQGWADTRPADDADTDQGHARNRRVELRFGVTAP
jgi:outer membrane protein OmpA-like peptidoglycan-associated protein